MRLRHAVIKRSFGRIFLHHLRSAYYAEINDAALKALERALAKADDSQGCALLDKLKCRGMVEEGPSEPFTERNSSELVSIEIEPVSRCNLQCGHCFAGFSKTEMTDTTFNAVLRGAEDLGAVELTFNGGEPLLHRRCTDWIVKASAQGLRPLLFTNGTLVSAAIARRLKEAGLAKATVSLDGFEPEHDALRGGGAWRRAVRGIRHLVGVGITVHITTMVHPRNEEHLDEFRRFCRASLGVSGVRLSTVAEMGRAASRSDLQLSAERFRAVYEAEPDRPPNTRGGHLPCLAGVNKLYITARGEVHGCHLFDGVSEPLGNLERESLEAICATIGQRSAGPVLKSFDQSQLRGCVGCQALTRCGGGCRARAWTMTGDRYGVDPVSCRKNGVSHQASAVAACP